MTKNFQLARNFSINFLCSYIFLFVLFLLFSSSLIAEKYTHAEKEWNKRKFKTLLWKGKDKELFHFSSFNEQYQHNFKIKKKLWNLFSVAQVIKTYLFNLQNIYDTIIHKNTNVTNMTLKLCSVPHEFKLDD